MISKCTPLGGAAAPIVITGSGLVSAAGRGMDTLMASLLEPRDSLAPLRRVDASDLPVELGYEVAIPGSETGEAHLRTSARLAIEDALADAGRTGRPLTKARVGLALGTTLGVVDELTRLAGDETSIAEARTCLSIDSLVASLAPSLEGPRSVFSLACTSGLCATEQAASDLAFGRAEAMLVGGFDTLGRFMQGGFCSLRSLAFPGAPDGESSNRRGLLLGEAACFLVLESLRSARERGVSTGAALVSQRLVSDGVDLTGPDRSGSGMARAISGSLLDAELEPTDIGAVLVTAVGSSLHEHMLKRCLEETLGAHAARVPISSHELAVGHVLASTSLLALAHAARILEEKRVYPAFSLDRLGSLSFGEAIPAVEPLTKPFVLALVVGFGGFNGAAVLGIAEELR